LKDGRKSQKRARKFRVSEWGREKTRVDTRLKALSWVGMYSMRKVTKMKRGIRRGPLGGGIGRKKNVEISMNPGKTQSGKEY